MSKRPGPGCKQSVHIINFKGHTTLNVRCVHDQDTSSWIVEAGRWPIRERAECHVINLAPIGTARASHS